MRLTSTLPEYLRLAEIEDDDARRAAWTNTYEAAHREIFETYHSAWGTHEHCLKAAADVPRLAAEIVTVEARARRLTELAEKSFREDGLLDDDLDVVLLVGARTSDGWVTELGGAVTLFLALEFLGDAPYDGVLVSHEALHVAHARRGAATWPEDCAASLFQEGIAIAISRQIHPGLADSAYLWFDDAHADWVADCERARAMIASRALEQLDTSYQEAQVRALFTVLESAKELPPRAGYWLGDLLTRRLLERHPSGELLVWDHPRTRAAVAAELETIASGG